VSTLPFFVFYSIFGFQRVADLIYAVGDQHARGFLLGATSGRTTLNGEVLQYKDGHSHIMAYGYPHIVAYDPAFAYEVAIIIREVIRRMQVQGESVIYYITMTNENYEMPHMPSGSEEGILRGMHRVRASEHGRRGKRAHLFGSGAILNEALKAQQILEAEYGVAADVWSITSFKQLRQDGAEVECWNLLHADEPSRRSYIVQCLEGSTGAFVVASDYVKALPDSIARWFPTALVTLGTDGFGRSESRPALRRYFGVDANMIAWAALVGLSRQGQVAAAVLNKARVALAIDPARADPLHI
jgi:pyruvate dehydrogenase E1 component